MGPPCGHSPRIPENCGLCKLYEIREDYRELWDHGKVKRKPKKPRKAPTRIALDCIHLSDSPVSGKSIGSRHPMRLYRECEAGHGYKCGCEPDQKCNAVECKDYQKDPDHVAK